MYGWENTSRFVRHEACPACGSKDNLARYESGSAYCFGCGFFERAGPGANAGHLSSSVQPVGTARRAGGETEDVVRPPPDDTVLGEYPPVVVDWITQYGLTTIDLIRYKIGWSKRREQLIYQFYGADQDLVLWQARNFRSGTTHKDRFYTSGTTADVIAAYYPKQTSDTACVVEDCISAIVVSKCGVSGIPVFSATLPEKKLARIAKMYKNVLVWLDSDKFVEAEKQARRFSMLGCRARVIHTKEDPKCYPLDFIETKVRM